MKKEYVQLDIYAPHSFQDVMIALLSEKGYEGFVETENGLEAYILKEYFNESTLINMMDILDNPEISYNAHILPVKNWNTEWEQNYPSVYVGSFCQIIPSFRQPKPNFRHTLIIDPKMSFGTGNHETTRLMIAQMKIFDFADQKVLDMGCGTAILGLLASKMGAKEITAIDIDPWSFENATENMSLNKAKNMEIIIGGAGHIPPTKYDFILANINKNVLLADMNRYVQHLDEGGVLLMSGFYEQDKPEINQLSTSLNLSIHRETVENHWMAISYHYTNQ